MIKRIAVVLVAVIVLLVATGVWLSSLLAPSQLRESWRDTRPDELVYLQNRVTPERGRVLMVVTNTDRLGNTERYTGYELTELARAYYVLQTNGFAVDIASPRGGKPPMLIDDDDMGPFDFAFLNDPAAQDKLRDTLPVEKVRSNLYQGVFFIGGKGAMFDFPGNAHIARLVREFNRADKVIAAVCHGPAAFVGVLSEQGRPLVENRSMTGFTNAEELLLMGNAEEVFPFLLQSKLSESGANFYAGPMYLDTVVQDGNLLTGQNPWSVWTLAERVVAELGYKPVPREKTREENAVEILQHYDDYGNLSARELLSQKLAKGFVAIDRNLLAMHGIVALMENKVGKAIDMINLVRMAEQANSVKADRSLSQSAGR